MATIETLHRRIEERFPQSGLGRLCASLLEVGENTKGDSVVLQAVDEVEALTMGLSRKIWQKIMILDAASGKQ